MDYSKKSRQELIGLCKEHKLKGYSNKTKPQIINMLNEIVPTMTNTQDIPIVDRTGHYTPLKNSIRIRIDSSTKLPVIDLNRAPQRGADSNLRRYKMIDLFAGTGAFSYAFEKTGKVDCIFANDMVETSKQIYDKNFSHVLTLGNLNDIKVEDIPKHHILTGGFPCQPFSIAGKQEGFQDVRSNVFWKILAIIDHRSPMCIVLENVKNLVSHDDGKTFEIIKNELSKRGYHIRFKVLNTAKITGIPQHRERIYIVCLKSKEVFDKFTLDFPDVKKKAITELLEDTVADKYYYTDKSSTWDLVKESVTKKNTVYQYRRVYVRENKSNECPTLTANMGSGGHNVPLVLDNKGIRKLTPRECFNFQGFPASYKLPALADSHLYKLAGNAVSVPVVELIAKRLLSLLSQEE
jgi:DNA (cytosine-5)-methyltransferase 1